MLFFIKKFKSVKQRTNEIENNGAECEVVSKLIVMVGLPASGKSTHAKKMENDGYTLVSSDDTRKFILKTSYDETENEWVFQTCYKQIIYQLNNGNNVIFDATNLRVKRRKQLINNIKKNVPETEFVCYIMVTPIDMCHHRNQKRDLLDQLPEYVIDNMARKFQIPFYEEGWSEIKMICPEGYDIHPGNILNSMINMRMLSVGFNQHTKHHQMTLDKHCEKYVDYLEKHDFPKSAMVIGTLHDYGKLFGHTVDEDGETWHYFGHAEHGAYQIMTEMLYMSPAPKVKDVYDNALEVLFYVNYHMLPFEWKSEKNKKKYRNIFGAEKFNNLIIMHEADEYATKE